MDAIATSASHRWERRVREVALDYERMRDMFFGPIPRFEEILLTLQELEARINA